MKKSLAVAVLASLVGVSAHAVGPGNLGTIDNMPITLGNVVAPGMFQDVYSFSIADPGDLSGNVVAINFGPYNIFGLTVTLQDATFALIGTDSTPVDGFTFAGLAAGNYALNVLGYATGSGGGFYGGGMTAQTAPVPEPETYALMLAGLAAIGFMTSRRRQS